MVTNLHIWLGAPSDEVTIGSKRFFGLEIVVQWGDLIIEYGRVWDAVCEEPRQ